MDALGPGTPVESSLFTCGSLRGSCLRGPFAILHIGRSFSSIVRELREERLGEHGRAAIAGCDPFKTTGHWLLYFNCSVVVAPALPLS